MNTIERTIPGLIREIPRNERFYSSSIMKVARHHAMVVEAARILEVADELQRRPELEVVAVVDAAERPLGYVTREHLFSTLGKPYGRDILSRSLIRDLCFEGKSFNQHDNLFNVVQDRHLHGSDYYVLVDDEGRFRALFSTRDLMTFLSHMTQEDIEMASRLQERMIGRASSARGEGWEFHAWCQPAKGVGGDFYLSRQLSDGRCFFCLCDVSGKGVAASILSSMVWGMLSMYDFRQGLRQLIIKLNEAVITTFQLERYLTGVFLMYDPRERRLQWADMGHSHLTLTRRGKTRYLAGKRANLPIGLEPSVWALRLEDGDRVFGFTDGITEQENAAKQEFGEARLLELLDSQTDPSLAERIPNIMDEFRQSIPQQDDMSFIMLEVQ